MDRLLYSRRLLVLIAEGVLLLGLGVLLTTGLSIMGNDDVGPPVVSADNEFVLIDNTADLLANIGRDDIELVLAPGEYVVPPCPGGLEQERSDPTCGQMQQGDNSVLRSDLKLELDDNGVPTGAATGGAIIDCSQLPPSALEFSCLVAGEGSTIRNLTIRNGLTTPEPSGPGEDPNHRNGIMILASKEAVVDEVRLMNTRRGVLFTTESGKETRGEVRHSLIDGTELAGIFLWARNPNGSSTSNSLLRGEVKANRLTNTGLHPLILTWTFGAGIGNDSHAEFTENIVDSSNFRGISILGNAQSAQDNTASFEIKGGRLEGSSGLLIIANGGNNSNNCVVGEVKGLVIENGKPAVQAILTPGWGTGNKFLLEMKDSVYLSDGTSDGEVRVTDDAGSDFQILGTPEEFLEDNTHFDISGVLPDDFTDDDEDC